MILETEAIVNLSILLLFMPYDCRFLEYLGVAVIEIGCSRAFSEINTFKMVEYLQNDSFSNLKLKVENFFGYNVNKSFLSISHQTPS